jgi:tetratricopeptide (TPR) repeat protein
MLRTATRALVAVVFLAACAGVAVADAAGQGRRGGSQDQPAQPPPEWKGKGRISGKVLDDQGKPLEGAIVMMRLPDVMSGPNIKTNKKGDFEARDIKAGEWTIRVQADTFLTHEMNVSLAEKGKVEKLEVRLEKDETAQLLEKGDELFKAGQFAAARAEYEKVLAARPDLPAIHNAIAYTYGREGNHAKALEHMDIALESEPGTAQTLQLAAASAIELKQPDRAVGYVDKIPDADLTPDLLDNVAINMLNKQFNAQAVTVLDRSITRFPDGPMAYFLRGLGRLRMQNIEGGKADLQKYLEVAPPDAAQVQQAKDILGKIK